MLHSLLASALGDLRGWIHQMIAIRPQYHLNRKLRGPQSQSQRFGKEKNLFPLPGIEPQSVGRPVCSLDTTPTKQPQLTVMH